MTKKETTYTKTHKNNLPRVFFTLVVYFLVHQSFRERDELLMALRAVRTSQQEAQQREWSACLQVKQAVEMAEEANLYKARVRETYTHTSFHSAERFLLSCPLKLCFLFLLWLVTSGKPSVSVCVHAGGGAV